MPDSHKNFAYSTVATAPSPATSGTSLVVASGDGSLFPTPPFNATVWPASSQPTAANAEIVRVTGISTDTFTITRTQESTSARTIGTGDQIAATITAKTLTDVETFSGARVTRTSNQAITNATETAISFDSEDYDTDSYHEAVTNPSRLTVPATGYYSIQGMCRWAGTANGGERSGHIIVNGGSTPAARICSSSIPPDASAPTCHAFACTAHLTAGDYVEMRVYQASGATLSIDVSSVLAALAITKIIG